MKKTIDIDYDVTDIVYLRVATERYPGMVTCVRRAMFYEILIIYGAGVAISLAVFMLLANTVDDIITFVPLLALFWFITVPCGLLLAAVLWFQEWRSYARTKKLAQQFFDKQKEEMVESSN